MELPQNFYESVGKFLNRGSKNALFEDENPAPKLAASTKDNQGYLYPIAASALVRSGVNAADIDHISVLVQPEHYRAIMLQLQAEIGWINTYAALIDHVLMKVARHGNFLDPVALSAIEKAHDALRLQHINDMREYHVDRDQELLAEFDEPSTLQRFLDLPRRAAQEVMDLGVENPRSALQMGRACAAQIWIDAPLRIAMLVRLHLRHFKRKLVGDQLRLFLIIPAKEMLKGKTGVEHLLSTETEEIVNTYIDHFLSFTSKGSEPFLFQGDTNSPKSISAFRIQMINFFQRAMAGRFHPHLVRKICTKIVLDDDPSGIAVARDALGHASVDTTKKYSQKVRVSSSMAYQEALKRTKARLQSVRTKAPKSAVRKLSSRKTRNSAVTRHGKQPPRLHEELPPSLTLEDRADERAANHGNPIVE